MQKRTTKEQGVSHEFMENPWQPSALLGNLVEDLDRVKKGGADFVTRPRSAIKASNMAPVYRRFESKESREFGLTYSLLESRALPRVKSISVHW